jgi:hypothetical protein
MPRSKEQKSRDRVEEIIRLRIGGAELQQIMEYAKNNAWNVGKRRLQYLMKEADDILARQVEKNRPRLIGLALQRRMDLYRQCLEAKDRRTALSVLRDLAQLFGLYPPKSLKIEDNTPSPTISREEQDQILQKLTERFTVPPPSGN